MSSSLPKLTLCICVRNGERHIDPCLASLFCEIKNSPLQVVVVDHLSTDKTAAKLEQWKQQEPKRLRVTSYEKDGLANARNHAWELADTEWVGFIDVDCRVLPGWYQAVAAAIQDYEREPLCAGFGGENHVPQSNLMYQCLGIILPSYVGGHGSALNRPVTDVIEFPHLPTLNVIYRRQALETVGGFNPAFLQVGEDLDLSYRLTQGGFQLWSCPGMVVEHHMRENLKAWLKNMFLYGRGRLLFMRVHPRSVEAKFFLPASVCLFYLLIAGAALFYPPLATWLLALTLLHTLGVALLLFPQFDRSPTRTIVYLTSVPITVLTHLAYGLGTLKESLWPSLGKEALRSARSYGAERVQDNARTVA